MLSNYTKIDQFIPENLDQIADNVRKILAILGEDVSREGLEKTPMRVAKALSYSTQGYLMNAVEVIKGALFYEDHEQMVLVKDIELYSMCEHHMLPFYGRAHIAYIPNGRITGLSKLARVVDIFSRRFQVQERLTCQIRDAIQEALSPHGVAVVIEAKHLCMMMRGVQKQNSSTTTSAFNGIFMSNDSTRKEFLHLVSANLH